MQYDHMKLCDLKKLASGLSWGNLDANGFQITQCYLVVLYRTSYLKLLCELLGTLEILYTENMNMIYIL